MYLDVRSFHERARYYYDPADEEVPLNICLHCMLEQYHIFLETRHFLLSRLMEASRRTKESMRTLRPRSINVPLLLIRLPRRKRPIVATLEKG